MNSNISAMATPEMAVKAPRQSNMELLRIIAMVMVLGVHVNFYSLGAPDKSIIGLNGLGRVFFEGLCIGCVNLFVMISGWFLIKPSLKGFCKFLFQIGFFVVLGSLLRFLIIGDLRPNLFEMQWEFFNAYWFVISYAGLYLIAPILNSFLKQASRKTILQFLCAFYAFQTIYGWILDIEFISAGYSTFSFIGLYVLAYYLRIAKNEVYSKGLIIFGVTVILNMVIFFLRIENSVKLFTNYTNPLTIIGCCGLMMWFSNLKIESNKIINYLAGSSFAVYLLHCHSLIITYFVDYSKSLYNRFDGLVCLGAVILFIIGVYLVSVAFDQGRIWLWNAITRPNYKEIRSRANILKLINR